MSPPSHSIVEVSNHITLSEVLAALSRALDLTEGQPAGHTVRTCVIGLRLADALGLDPDDRAALRYALLLKDAGCSSNAARLSALFGSDDRTVKPRMKLVDWHQRMRLAVHTFRNAALGRSLDDRVRHFLRIARTKDMTRDLIQIRCERGAEIARALGFPEETACAIRSLDEHWNGGGHPDGLSRERIPLLARIANLAQVVEVFHREHGLEGALRVARMRRGRWFDPELVDALLSWHTDRGWWDELRNADESSHVVRAARSDRDEQPVGDHTLDEVARAFADIIDAKSPYTFRHSTNVADLAVGVSAALGHDVEAQHRLRRAGLLHDIGKLGVSNRILDKAGPLTTAERAEVERHPLYTWEILSRVRAFDDFAMLAAVHHEKLDGSGYPWGLRGDALEISARALAVADMFEALTADRPYRAGLTQDEAMAILRRDAGTKVCAEAIAGLETHLARVTAAVSG